MFFLYCSDSELPRLGWVCVCVLCPIMLSIRYIQECVYPFSLLFYCCVHYKLAGHRPRLNYSFRLEAIRRFAILFSPQIQKFFFCVCWGFLMYYYIMRLCLESLYDIFRFLRFLRIFTFFLLLNNQTFK